MNYITKEVIKIRRKNRKIKKHHPSFSYCNRCHLPWILSKEISIGYNVNAGTFRLCESCWNESSLKERVFWYCENPEYDFDYTDEELYTLIKNICEASGKNVEFFFRKQKLEKLMKCYQ